jgi:hypothetical protein
MPHLQSYNTVKSCSWLQTFLGNFLPLSSGCSLTGAYERVGEH